MMKTTFEDELTKLQLDMVDICQEFSMGKTDKIYIYCAQEGTMTLAQFFFEINHDLVKKNKLSDYLKSKGVIIHDITDSLQEQSLNIILSDLNKIVELCKNSNREIPTEIKICYCTNTNKMETNLSYSKNIDDNSGAYSQFHKWFDYIQSKEAQCQ